MAIRNKYSVKIEGINLTHYAVIPFDYANLLDERLDEAYLPLRHVPFQSFSPTSIVEIEIFNTLYFGKNDIDTQSEEIRYIIANPNDGKESPVGSGLYDHNIYIIEETKYLETIIVDSCTYTNSLGKSFSITQTKVVPDYVDTEGIIKSYPNYSLLEELPSHTIVPNSYITPEFVGTTLRVESLRTVFDYNMGGSEGSWVSPKSTVLIKFNGTIIHTISGNADNPPYDTTYDLLFNNEGTYEIKYNLEVSHLVGIVREWYYGAASFIFTIVANKLPLKRLTCTDVINRLLDIAIPIRLGEQPSYRLNAEQAVLFDKIYAPQYSFTKQHLRECLQEVGKTVHGEPRLRTYEIDGASGEKETIREIYYDMYGNTEQWHFGKIANVYKSSQRNIDMYCSHIDSSAQNLVNQLDYAQGTIVEPYDDGFKTVRTETQYVRISDSNIIIPTSKPVYLATKIECGYIPGYENLGKDIDITDFIFNRTEYNSKLSSNKDTYPYSKAYAIYFTQGEKNIQGLNFKADNAINAGVFSKYAIINILEKKLGITINTTNFNYSLLAFRISYLPFYNIRVQQSKPYYLDYKRRAGLIYNQTTNIIENTYYGENLKGTVARLGNLELSATYNLSRLNQIPKAGQMYDEDYYISAVSVEILPTYIKCTVGLSKDFNRINEYIGISSEKRYSEVSEKQAYERELLYPEYIVIGDEIEWESDYNIKDMFVTAVADIFRSDKDAVIDRVTAVYAWGGTFANPVDAIVGDATVKPMPPVLLPIVSSAEGNSVSFSWSYEDNFSAGAISEYGAIGNVNGYWQTDYNYTDYYGRMYYYNFTLNIKRPAPTSLDNQTEIGLSLPDPSSVGDDIGIVLSTRNPNGSYPYIIRKDNREIPQVNTQIDFVTNRRDLIIGSGIASNCALVRGQDASIIGRLYVLPEKLNKFTYHVEGSIDIDLSTLTPLPLIVNEILRSGDASDYVPKKRFSLLMSGTFPTSGKSWAIITDQTRTAEQVEDEYGNVITQYTVKGGDLLLGCNVDIEAGVTEFTPVFFTPKHDVYEENKT